MDFLNGGQRPKDIPKILTQVSLKAGFGGRTSSMSRITLTYGTGTLSLPTVAYRSSDDMDLRFERDRRQFSLLPTLTLLLL